MCEFAPPALWPENRLAWRVYVQFGTQLRAGSSGVLGLDYTPIFEGCGRLGIEVDQDLMDRLRAIEGFILERQAEDFKRAQEERDRQRSRP